MFMDDGNEGQIILPNLWEINNIDILRLVKKYYRTTAYMSEQFIMNGQ